MWGCGCIASLSLSSCKSWRGRTVRFIDQREQTYKTNVDRIFHLLFIFVWFDDGYSMPLAIFEHHGFKASQRISRQPRFWQRKALKNEVKIVEPLSTFHAKCGSYLWWRRWHCGYNVPRRGGVWIDEVVIDSSKKMTKANEFCGRSYMTLYPFHLEEESEKERLKNGIKFKTTITRQHTFTMAKDWKSLKKGESNTDGGCSSSSLLQSQT